MLAPTIAITALMQLPVAPVDWQRALYVNLTSGGGRAEVRQGLDFLEMVQHEGAPTIYMVPLDASARNFEAAVSYWSFYEPWRVPTQFRIPVDWSRSTTFRLDEISGSDFVLFEPVLDESARRRSLESKSTEDFTAETELIQAWLSTLDANDGVAIVSETRLRLFRIVDHDRFQLALDRLRRGYIWRPTFVEANP